jgi:hypothetical protein
MPNFPSLRPQPALRALTPFKSLPPAHKTFEVTRDGAEPHLNVGEFAVVDTTDREVQHGELYLIQWSGGARRRKIVHVRGCRKNIKPPGSANYEPAHVWYVGDLRGFRKVGHVGLGGPPEFVGVSDGPYETDHLQEKLIGRIVGFASSSLGDLLAPELGFVNEKVGNDAFDPGEYIDTLLTAGYSPTVINGCLVEMNPAKGRTPEQEAAVLAVQYKRAAASTAVDRVKAECIRRGLVSAKLEVRRHG